MSKHCWPVLLLLLLALPQSALAAAKIDPADTAWMLMATALVLLMLIPGLALFYGGMVPKESVLGVFAQSFAVCCLVSVLWVLYGYSIAFTAGSAPYWGGASKLLLHGLGVNSISPLAPTIPESVYVMFQLTFAAITCALMLGAVATRIRFGAMLGFTALWFTFVYLPIAHWVWGEHGWLGGAGLDHYAGALGLGATLDYAGGTVVHINAGVAGLVMALVMGKGFDYHNRRKNTPPYHIGLSLVGAALLWVGWFGFNAGSALSANGHAGLAMLATQMAAGGGAITWMLAEWRISGRPTMLGILSGAVAGLVAVTPACGYVGPGYALIIGLLAGVICYFATQLKYKFGVDDTLDVFGVHGVGGILGALFTGVFAEEAVGGVRGALEGNMQQLYAQAFAVAVTLAYSGIVSFVLLKGLSLVTTLRLSEQEEEIGLDMSQHGEIIHG